MEPADRAVRDLAGQLGHSRAVRGDVDLQRRLRQLHVQVEVLDREDLALVARELAREDPPEDRDEVAHRRDRLAVLLPVPGPHVAARLHAEPEDQAPARQLVQRRRLQRHRHRRPRPDAHDAGGDPDPLGLQRGGGRRPERVAERDLREPGRLPARRLRAAGEVDRQRRRQPREEEPEPVASHAAEHYAVRIPRVEAGSVRHDSAGDRSRSRSSRCATLRAGRSSSRRSSSC